MPKKKSKSDQPFIKLLKKFQKSRLWQEPRVFSKAEAWIDLLLTANWNNKTWETREGDLVQIDAGDIVTSQRKLADRWKWSPSKVSRFLKMLEKDGKIACNKLATKLQQRCNHFSIVNFKEIHGLGSLSPTRMQQTCNKLATQTNTTRERESEKARDIYKATVAPIRKLNGAITGSLHQDQILFFSDEATAALIAWAEYRQERRQKITARSVLGLLKKYNMRESEFIAAVEHSIAQGWQGLFEPKSLSGQVQKTKQDLIREKNAAHYLKIVEEEKNAGKNNS